jgi:hypothetical protein
MLKKPVEVMLALTMGLGMLHGVAWACGVVSNRSLIVAVIKHAGELQKEFPV